MSPSLVTADRTLSGKVTMPFKRDDIARRIAKVAGVREVRDNDSNFWSYAIMPNPPIHIVVEHGRVTLTGGVQSNVDWRLARSLAAQFGAFSVTSELKTDAEMNDAVARSE